MNDPMFTMLSAADAAGPPFLLLHGFAGHPLDWRPVFQSSKRRAVAATLFGHGPHPVPPPDDYVQTVDALAARIAAVGPGPWHLCGYSLGARLALGLLWRHPHMWQAATLIGVHPGLDDPQARKERARADSLWEEMLYRDGIARFVDAWEAQPLFATQHETGRIAPALRAATHARRLTHDPRVLARAHASTSLAQMPCLWKELHNIDKPIHLVTGHEDAKFSQIAKAMRSHLPKVTHTALPHCGHNPLLEAPQALSEVALCDT